jgi:NADH:ubiquinone oxidoreductase subunit B-like Fe-S oxidoreductase
LTFIYLAAHPQLEALLYGILQLQKKLEEKDLLKDKDAKITKT